LTDLAAVPASGATRKEGRTFLTGQTVRLSGVVDLPADRDAITAALSLPEGYTLDNAIETRDDGKPVAFNVLYSAAEGASVTGKLPAGYDVAQIAGALGLQSASGTPDVGLTGSGDAATAALEGLKPWLAELETAAVDVSDSGVAITGEVSPGADPAALQNLMTDAFGDEARVRLTDLAAVPASGATRTNQATGEAERFTGGFWLPDTSN